MRFFYAFTALFFVFHGYAQTNKKTVLSGIIITSDSVPVANAAIINTRTFKTVPTDSLGFFQTEIEGNDSLQVYHIAYKRRFINEKDNGRFIIIEPEMHQLNQVDIRQDYHKTLKDNLGNIKELASQKKLTKEEMKSLSQIATDQHGSHNRGFVAFFGPATHISYGKFAELIGSHQTKRQRKQLTSHYHLIKPKSIKRRK